MTGPYRLFEHIRNGAVGPVHRAADTVRERLVAVEVVDPARAAQPGFRDAFDRWSARVAGLAHPHVLTVHRWTQADGWLVQETQLVDGPDLGTLVARHGPLPPDAAVALIEQVGSALEAARAAGFAHGRLHPSQVLVDRRPGRPDVALLTGFPLQPATDHRADVAGLAGLLEYASGGHRAVRGVVAGARGQAPPADGNAFAAAARRALRDTRRRTRTLAGGGAVVAVAVAVLTGMPATGMPATGLPAPDRPAARVAAPAPTVTDVVVPDAPIALGITPDGARLTVHSSTALTFLDTGTGTVTGTMPAKTNIHALGRAAAPATSREVFLLDGSDGALRVDPVTGQVLGRYPEIFGALTATADGSRVIAPVHLPSGIATIDVASGRTLDEIVLDVRMDDIRTDPAGRHAVTIDQTSERPTLVDLSAGRILTTVPLGMDDAVFSADGTQVYLAATGAGRVVVLDAATGSELRRVDVGFEPRGLTVTPDGRVWVCGTGLATIDPAGGAVTDLGFEGLAGEIAVTPDGRHAWLGHLSTARLQRVDLPS